jgi:hypothetical protein
MVGNAATRGVSGKTAPDVFVGKAAFYAASGAAQESS